MRISTRAIVHGSGNRGAPPGESLGGELITNGTFDASTDWDSSTGWIITGGEATISGTSGTLVQAALAVSAEVSYRLTLDVAVGSTFDATGITVRLRPTGDTVLASILTTGPQSFILTTEAGVGDPEIQFSVVQTGGSTWSFDGALDNISLKEIL